MEFKVLFKKYYGKEILVGSILLVIGWAGSSLYKWIFVSDTNLNGYWKVALKIKNSTYKPYLNMGCEYRFTISQNGDLVQGSAEKYNEISADGKVYNYNGNQRLYGKCTGHIENGHFGNADITLTLDEKNIYGKINICTFKLKVIHKDSLVGTFITSAAEAEGIASMKRIE
jgi:hypothetical protein